MKFLRKRPMGAFCSFGADPALTPRQAGKIVGLDEDTLANWRCLRIGPTFVKYRGSRGAVRYPMRALLKWRQAHQVVVTSDPQPYLTGKPAPMGHRPHAPNTKLAPAAFDSPRRAKSRTRRTL